MQPASASCKFKKKLSGFILLHTFRCYEPAGTLFKMTFLCQLTISEAHRLPYKLVPNPYCVISLNQVKVAKTKVKSGQDPVFDEVFELE